MYGNFHTEIDLTLAQLDQKAAKFKALKHPGDLAALLKADAAALAKLASKPHYQVFSIPKPGGDKRVIHNPVPDLKNIQQLLNLYLQAAYYGLKPACSYGFIPKPSDEPHPRNIYTNALVHAGSEWVLNLDMKDYFHTVTSRHLQWIFGKLFEFPAPLCNQLIGLTSYKGVLPMGAPTSPVLSNLAALPLDAGLQVLANKCDALYTRYVDDLTFSFDAQPEVQFTQAARQVVESQGFALNEGKIRLSFRQDEPEVTGLILKSPKPDVSPGFLKSLKKDIKLYRYLCSPDMLQRGIVNAGVLEKLQRSIRGQLAFLSFIRGKQDKTYRRLAALEG